MTSKLRAPRLSWRPLHLTSTYNMNVQMVDSLAALLAIVDYDTKTLATLFLADLASNVQHVAENVLLVLTCCGQLHQSIALLGDDQNMRRSLRVDITKSVAELIVVDLLGIPLTRQDLVEDRWGAGAVLVAGLILGGCLLGRFHFV